MADHLIKGALLVNEGQERHLDVLVRNGHIEQIGNELSVRFRVNEVAADGLLLLPGCIDDQVHFREPGLTHKADLTTESRAAVAGGITSYMEMPNTVPNVLTQELLEQKYQRAAQVSAANYSFFMGAGNDNLAEVLRTDPRSVCGIKIFMGSSTGNMLVDNEQTLDAIFSQCPMLIATHCEDETTVRANTKKAIDRFGEDIPMAQHPVIRDAEACYLSSSKAVRLAQRHGTRLHILHISTAKELSLFRNDIPLCEKMITAEACIHHLTFTDSLYATKGSLLKWNPAVKTEADRQAIFQAVIDGRIDVIATDHAPHTWDEKQQGYLKAPSGGPLVQHALPAMLDHARKGAISRTMVVQKMAHNVADLFRIEDRGYIREGYWADLVLVDPTSPWTVQKDNLLYKCGWSIFEGTVFADRVTMTMVNGHVVWNEGRLIEAPMGKRLTFRA
jgi:dihydroorotase